MSAATTTRPHPAGCGRGAQQALPAGRRPLPRRVAEAYGGDFERAAADSDEAVAATVAAWERASGEPALDWPAIGAAERGET